MFTSTKIRSGAQSACESDAIVMRLFVLHNPTAGEGRLDRDMLLAVLRAHGHDPVYRSSKDKRWPRALDESFDLLVAAGGDGTVAKLARASRGPQIPIAVLPLGTANNVSSALGVASCSPDDLVDGWADAERQSFDLGVATGPWGTFRFLESIGLGLVAEVIAEVKGGTLGVINRIPDPQLRLDAARRACEDMAGRMRPIELDVAVDGRRVTGQVVLMEAMNFGAVGPNLQLTPGASCHDGLLDLVFTQDAEREQLVSHLRQEGLSPPSLNTLRGRSITLWCSPCHLHLDDQLWTLTAPLAGPIELSVEPDALTFVVPRRLSAH